ncbi:transmembrane 9 superfamily member 3-like protein isoform X1 [Cinnamomum micranthum f. kanehirae]|uniref:Transmembrane 9 superfamily member 3-like protein isoform X1 n=1 Tax=Cinnamomum micranthum f. kanehirae TaxID=337451 RepID=A0A443N9H8_9MAGN|nr:transmembrane 9 superfamily member 3-like protein isoform X1 [Cinnamomum micranthum f. kanehirae]
MMITVSANPNLFKLLPPPNLSSSFCIISKTKAFSFPLCSGNLQILNSSWRRDALRSPRAAASISGSAEGSFDPELRLVLELATDSEFYFSPLLKSITNRADVDITHGGEYEGREDYIEHLESRFLFLAADARSTLRRENKKKKKKREEEEEDDEDGFGGNGYSLIVYVERSEIGRLRSQTYRYFDLPFCLPAHVTEKKRSSGEVLNGDRLVVAPYKLDFLVDRDSEEVCKKKLSKKEVAKFRNAVTKDYYFQMYYDDLPIWGFIGKVDKEGKAPSEYKYFLYKHIHFEILYNKDRIIEITVHTDPNAMVDVTEDKEVNVEFTYTVKWRETDLPFDKRMEKYSRSSSYPHHLEIHWFSIINSCVTVLLLTGFLATILMRVLKNDFVKYAHDEESAEDQEETGWKYIHGDVFRYPKNKSLFAAALGSGTQLFTLTIFIFILALVGVFYPYNRGALFTALVVIYALTSGIAGYTATSFYCQLEGTNWVRNLVLTGCLFCGPLYFSPLLKSITNRADVDITHGGEYEGREDYIEHLESRFLFLAADARSTLRGWRPSYRSVLLDVRRKLKIPCTSKLSTEDLEAEIFLHLLQEYSSEESGSIPFSSDKFADSNSPGSLEVGLGPWKRRALSILKVGAEELRSMILKGGGMLTVAKIYQLLARRLSGTMLSEAANYQIKREILKKGGQLAAINLESRTALLAARKGFACAASRYLGLRSLMMLLGPVLWGTFLADVVIQMIGTDYARILRAIYAFAQIRLTRTYGWVSNKKNLVKNF